MQLKFYRYTIAAYSTILLLSLALFYALPKGGLLDLELASGSEAQHEIYQGHMEEWAGGELDRKAGVHPHKQWQFEYDGGRLEIVAIDSGERVFPPQLLIKRTAPGAGVITAAEYRLFSSSDFPAGWLNPYSLELTGGRLLVKGAERIEFKFKAFIRDFTAEQFREDREEQEQEWRMIPGGFEFMQGLYLYVPAGVEIDHDPERVLVIFADADEEGRR